MFWVKRRRQAHWHHHRIAHPGRALALGAGVALSLAFAFIAGYYFREPVGTAVAQNTQTIDVWAPIEERNVDPRQRIPAVIKDGATADITLTEPGLVVVKQTLNPGDSATGGTLVGVASGKPYFLLPAPLPLYRNLRLNDSGDDVLALQNSLSQLGYTPSRNGTIDRPTLAAVAALFRANGYRLYGSSPPLEQITIPRQQLVPVPASGGPVTTAAPVGTTLDPGTPLISIRTSPPYAEFIADITTSETLNVEQRVTLQTPTGALPGTIADIQAFRAGENNHISGRPVTISYDTTTPDAPIPGSTLTVLLGEGADDKSLAVPLSAIRQNNDTSYVLARDDPQQEAREVPITVTRTGGGYAAITAELRPGQEVKVT